MAELPKSEGSILKILVFYKPTNPNYRSIFNFPYALAKHADVKYYGKIGAYTIEENPTENSIPWQTYGHIVMHGKLSESIDAIEIIKKLYPKDYPDAVVTLIGGSGRFTPKNFDKCKCPRVVWSFELHNDFSHSPHGKRRLQLCREKKFNLVFKSYDPNNRLNQSKWLEDTGVAVEMNPPSVNTDFFYDRQLPKNYDIANIWQRNSPKTYPLRWKIHETLPLQKQWSYREASTGWIKGEKVVIPREQHMKSAGPRGDDYVNAICQSRVFATGSGRYKRYGIPVFKWVEVPACNTLLMINKLSPPDDMNAMGFKPDVNFVAINQDNFLERIQYYLSHPDDAKTIAQRGYELIRSKHSQNIRAKEFIDKIRKHL
ncbi:hypothetical protein ES705_31752 [subsurface metagenome]